MTHRPFAAAAAALIALAGCASNPNSAVFENKSIQYEVLVTGPKQFRVMASSAFAMAKLGSEVQESQKLVERAVRMRAEQLCGSPHFEQTSKANADVVRNMFPTVVRITITGEIACKST